MAIPRRFRCARMLPQPVSLYGVTKLAAEQLCYLYREPRRAGDLGAVFHGGTVRGNGRTWRFTGFQGRA